VTSVNAGRARPADGATSSAAAKRSAVPGFAMIDLFRGRLLDDAKMRGFPLG
jgi:hypothetical protein